ncbi:MAG: hypothetical protein AAFO84_04850 [Cyanobacteria bacterium J06598_1]
MSQISEMDDELRPEYDFAQMTPVARGRGRAQVKGAVVQLEPDVAAFFPDAGAVNEGLRLLIRMLQKAQPSEAVTVSSAKNA